MPAKPKTTECDTAATTAGRIRSALLDWYGGTARTLPWRTPPGDPALPDPYRVWLSEIMLQQTTVAAVRPRFDDFVARWPNVEALASADDGDVMAAWAGLGYYARARNLIACARAVCDRHGGQFPAEEGQLRALPGIGDYSAAAISSIAFGRQAVAIDANVVRVVARLFAIETPLPGARRCIDAAARALWPETRAGDFAQALMDLGSAICTARAPRCADCPLAAECRAYAQGIAADLPRRAAKPDKPLRHGRAWWIERQGANGAEVLLVRRPDKGMLGGMRALPGTAWFDVPQQARHGDRPLGTVRHVFTHFVIDLAVDRVDADGDVASAIDGIWWPVQQLAGAGLPTLYAHAARIATGGGVKQP